MQVLKRYAATIMLGLAASVHAAPQTQWMDDPAGRLAYDDTGSGAVAVLAVPGIGEVRGQYRLLRPGLVADGRRVITLDPRGQGESSVAWPDYSAHTTASDVLRLMARLKLEQVVLVGNSFSAGAVLIAAHAAPERVKGVVLIGPVVHDEPQSWPMRALIRLAFDGPWASAAWMYYWDSLFPSHQPPDHAAYRAALRARMDEPGRMDVLRRQIALPKSEAQAVIDALRLPSLTIMGERDPDFAAPTATARQLARRLGGEVLVVAGAGHYPHVEYAPQVLPEIRRFVDAVTRAGR